MDSLTITVLLCGKLEGPLTGPSGGIPPVPGKTKKPLKRSASRTSAKTTPWYHLASHASSRRRPYRVPAHSRAVTGAPVAACALRQSAAQLQDHVRPALPYPFSPLGALFDVSSGVLFSSSSLQLFNCWKCFVVYTLSAALSTAKPTKACPAAAENIGKAHNGAEKPGEILPEKRESDCKTPAKLLSYSA